MADQTPMVLDASAAIVLFASGRIGDIVNAVPVPVFVVRETIDEVRFLRNPEAGTSGGAERVDWQPLLTGELIGVVDRTHPREFAEFVRLAQLVDEGEAAAAAAAIHRGYRLVIDDRKARRVLESSLRLCWSLDLVYDWCQVANIPPVYISTILTDIRRKATYHPHRSHPRLHWWQQHFVSDH